MKTNETYDTIIALNVDVQNDYSPGGRVAVPGGNEVIEPLNQLNSWVRDQNNGMVFFARDWHNSRNQEWGDQPPHCILHKAGAAFPDELEVLRQDALIADFAHLQRNKHSSWDARLDRSHPMYSVDDGRATGVTSLKEVAEQLVNVYGSTHKRVAVLIGGLATDGCVETTVLDALQNAREMEAAMEKLSMRPGRFELGYNLVQRCEPTPLTQPLGIFVVREAIRAYDKQPGDGEAAIAQMQAAGAQFINLQELIADNVLSTRS